MSKAIQVGNGQDFGNELNNSINQDRHRPGVA